MLDMTGKPFFPTGNKKNLKTFLKFFFEFFFEKKPRKRRIVSKNEKGDPLGFINILSVAKYQKIRRGDSFETLKIFEKKFAQCRKKIEGRGPFGVFRFCRLRKKSKKRKGGPFAVSLHLSNLA